MSDPSILVTRGDGLLELRFNRPAKKNAITNAMYGALADAIEAAQEDPAVRVILFTAAGDFFTAGNDLHDFAAIATGATTGDTRHASRFLEACVRAAQPLVASVQGHAVGVGATLLFQCDLVYVAEDARLSTPFVDLGLVPENASSLTMPLRMGHTRAFAMLGLGEPLCGRDAVQVGLANESLPAAAVEARARAAAQALARKPAESLRLTKRLMRNPEVLLERIAVEGKHFGERLQSDEARAAFAAFFARR